MKRLLLAAVAAFSIGVAHADTVYDPLHGCTTSGCTEANIGGNDVTPITTATNFGFFASPANSGNLELKFLFPDSLGLAAAQSFASTVSVTGTSSASLSLFSPTPWTSGFLETDYLHNTLATGAPKNPLDAFLGATNTLQPTADGYFVLLAEVGPYSLPTPGGVLPDVFSLTQPALFPTGGLILGNLFLDNGTVVSTAQSGALFNQGPGPVVGAGLPGLVAACGALLALARRRRRLAA